MATNAALRLHAQSARFRALPVVLFYQLSLVAYLILSLWISDGFVFTDTFLNLLTFQKASNSMTYRVDQFGQFLLVWAMVRWYLVIPCLFFA